MQSLIEVFEDCVQRLTSGESLERCLSRYPSFAEQLRPMLETVISLRRMQIPQAEVIQDKAIVWDRIQWQMNAARTRSTRGVRSIIQVGAAVFVLLLLLTTTWFVLTRPDLPPDPNEIVPLVTTETPTQTPTQTATQTLTLTSTPTQTATQTPTHTSTQTPTQTSTQTPMLTSTPTASPTPSLMLTASPTVTFAPGCGAPLSAGEASARVLEIYPNTTILSVTSMEMFGGRLVWEVRTSHQIVVVIDVACGTILTIERANSGSEPTPSADNVNDNEVSDTGSNDNEDDDSNDNEEENETD